MSKHLHKAGERLERSILGRTPVEKVRWAKKWLKLMLKRYPRDQAMIYWMYEAVMARIDLEINPKASITMNDNRTGPDQSVNVTNSPSAQLSNVGANSWFHNTSTAQINQIKQSTTMPAELANAMAELFEKIPTSELKGSDKKDALEQLIKVREELEKPKPDQDQSEVTKYWGRVWDVIKTSATLTSIGLTIGKLLGYIP